MTDDSKPIEPVDPGLERHHDTIVVVASGEIDLSCAGALEARLRGLLGRARRVVLDLRDVRFMDSSGVHCVLDVDRASRAAGVEFVVVPGPPEVQQIFQITGTDALLRFIDVREPSGTHAPDAPPTHPHRNVSANGAPEGGNPDGEQRPRD
jgi:anti-sigma B factor antagonist